MAVNRPVESVSRPNLTCPHKSGSASVFNSAQNTPIHTGTRKRGIAPLKVFANERLRRLAVSITSDDMRDWRRDVLRAAPRRRYRDERVPGSVSSGFFGSLL